jgi:nucleotide-binding universal stress UspA family protein
MLRLRTILHPTDFSERSGYAFQLACALAWDHGARLVVLHVQPPVLCHALVPLSSGPPAVWRALEEQLSKLRPPDPDVSVEHHLTEGDPAAEILYLAQQTHCDLIVMGTQGRTALDRLLLGSVAEAVLRKAPCPVLTVRGPLPDALAPSGMHPEPATVGGGGRLRPTPRSWPDAPR